jgi:tRNA nucleotidyltransferase (CCA-adding enzyme)
MQVYSVGGSVRDELLGLPVKDRDWVVVGAEPDELVGQGYKPVGRDFPVFLHPRTHEEYALARTERKVGRGYRGFTVHAAPDVTLEQDLERRDLTINAMARDENGALIDPFNGRRDLESGILRHVSPAFSEDPVRILRVARFAARFGFQVAPETLALMQSMVADGEADALVAERVWQEFGKGLMERDPWRMLAVLAQSGLLARWLPELRLTVSAGDEVTAPGDAASANVRDALVHAVREAYPLAVRFTLVTRNARGRQAEKEPVSEIESVCRRMRVPADCRDLAVLAEKRVALALQAPELPPDELLELLEASDALRRPQRLEDLMRVAECEAFAQRRWADRPFPPRRAAQSALRAAQGVDAAAIARAGGDIAGRHKAARIESIASRRGDS